MPNRKPSLKKLLPNGFMPEFERFYFDIVQIPMRPLLGPLGKWSRCGASSPALIRSAVGHVDRLKRSRVFSALELCSIDTKARLLMLRLPS